MTPRLTPAQAIAIAGIIAAGCWFDLVVTYWWVMSSDLPTSKIVMVCLIGLTCVGTVISFALAMITNVVLQRTSANIRLLAGVIAWVGFCGVVVALLLERGAEPDRLYVAGSIASIGGLLISPFLAVQIVGLRILGRD
jgi:hypothetical protein